VTVASIATSEERVMRHFAKRARSLVRTALVACVISSAAPAVAQDPDPPTMPDAGEGRGGLLAPSAWLVLNTPVRKPIDLKVYGFYIGELGIPVGQVDVPIRAARFLTITPSYMGYRAPASGLNKLTPEPGPFTDSYHEHQFRIDGTVAIPVRKLEVSVRNMYVRRFRPDLGDVNRYRGRISFAHPLAAFGKTVKSFASYEAFYEKDAGRNKDRLWTGVTVPINRRVLIQPSYMFESSPGSRDLHYMLFGLIVNTR
jgi:uncharacterized protein DUF2490